MLPADHTNRHGFFEDLEFLDLNRRLVAETVRNGADGHPDWGWTECERQDRGRFAAFAPAADALVAERVRRAAGAPWGWKDPRASLALDFWSERSPAASFVLLYRLPWEVADSMQRLEAPVFLKHPEWAARIWCFYQRAILDFRRRRPERTILVSSNALWNDPEATLGVLARRLGADLLPAHFTARRDRELFVTWPADDPLVSVYAATHPEAVALLAESDATADVPATGLWRPQPIDQLAAPADEPPRLSVVVPCHDHGEFLIEAVASVFRCVPRPFELLIVDDGSRAPRTLEVLATLEGAGVRVLRQPHRGLGAARNAGFVAARADLLLPLDADNRLLPGYAETALQMLEAEPDLGAVYGDRVEFGLRSGAIRVPDFDLDALLVGNYIDACAVVRRRLWQESGGYDENMPLQGLEDWDFWLAAGSRGWRLRRLDRPAFEYRVRPDSLITAFENHTRRDRIWGYIVGKHQALYRGRLAKLLESARRTGADQDRR
jgi:GT2 family glycosyltransferase